MVYTLTATLSFSRLLSAFADGMPATVAPTTAKPGSASALRRAASRTVTSRTLRDLVGNRHLRCEIFERSFGDQLRGWLAVSAVPPDVRLPHHPAVERFSSAANEISSG